MKKALAVKVIKELLGEKEDVLEALREEMLHECRNRYPNTERLRSLSFMYDEVAHDEERD